jgi:MFS family permease
VKRAAQAASGWSRGALLAVIAHSLLVQVIMFSVRPTLSYAALENGMPAASLGLLSAAYAAPGILLAIPTGRLTDRFGERTIVLTGGVLILAAVSIAAVARDSVGLIVLVTVLLGIGQLISVVGDQAILANKTLTGRRDDIFGRYAFSIALGQAIGAGLLSINAAASSTPDIALQFAIAIGISIGLVVAAAFMRSSAKHVHPVDAQPRLGVRALIRRPGVARAILASALVVTAMEISIVYFPAIGYERGYPAAAVSAMLVARALASMTSRLGLGWQVRLFGRRRLMVGSVASSALLLAAIALPVDAVWVILLCALFGFVNGVSQPLTLSWLSEIAPPGKRATVMSLRVATNRFAQSAVPVGLGAFGALVGGASGVILATAGLLGLASWLSAAIGVSPTPDLPPEPEVVA